jgi:hypothetical protein
MAQNRQARNLKVGKYSNCAVMYHEATEEGTHLKWQEIAEVVITDSWATVTFLDGSTRRFVRKTNRSLQIYPGMTLEKAKADREWNRVRSSTLDPWTAADLR